MTTMELQRAVGAYAYREQMCNFVVDCVQYSERHFNGVRQKWPRLYDLWRGSWSGRFHPHKNNVHIPLINSAIWVAAARQAATSLSGYPMVSFLGYGPDDFPIAQKQEALFSAQAKDDRAFLKQVDAIVSANLYGTVVMQVGWKRDERERIIESIERMPLSDRVIRSIRKGKVVQFDGPETLMVDLLDFFPMPCVSRLADMKWVVRRYFLDLDDVRYMASIGAFDKAELARLEREGATLSGQGEIVSGVRRFQVRTGMDDDTARFMDKYSRPIEILEFWGSVPSEYSPDGVLHRVVTVANRRFMLRNKPNPYWHGLIPFISYSPSPDPHYFYAAGKAEVVEKLQIVGNRYLNQSLDAADLMIDPMWFYDRGAGLVTRNLYSRPGRFIPVTGDPSKVVASMIPNLQHLSAADAKINQIREFAQMGTGIVDDAVAGLAGSDRQTAREFIGRREAAGTRLMLEARIYEEMMLEPMANMFIALNRQFLTPPVEVIILGDGAMIDPRTNMPFAGSRDTISDYDLHFTYQARAMGAAMGLSKQMRQSNWVQLLQAMASPLGQAAMGQINAVNFFRGVFKDFDVQNINEIFQMNPMLQQLAMQASGGAGLSAIPSSGQIVNGGPSVLAGLPGFPEGSAQSMMVPPDMQDSMAPAAA